MIAFPQAKDMGRLGNRLFIYAFVRSKARELNTKFSFPYWEGEDIFSLEDQEEKIDIPTGLKYIYEDNTGETLKFSNINIQDNTLIKRGYFFNEQYFSPEAKNWYTFRKSAIRSVLGCEGYDCSLHIRQRDMRWVERIQLSSKSYYKQALEHLNPKKVLVLSDEPKRARSILRGLEYDFTFVEGNTPHEDLYLMTTCKNNILSISTLAWWGAYLNPNPDKIVICPGHRNKQGYKYDSDIYPPNWIKIYEPRKIYKEV